jgi:hypothetical protein
MDQDGMKLLIRPGPLRVVELHEKKKNISFAYLSDNGSSFNYGPHSILIFSYFESEL